MIAGLGLNLLKRRVLRVNVDFKTEYWRFTSDVIFDISSDLLLAFIVELLIFVMLMMLMMILDRFKGHDAALHHCLFRQCFHLAVIFLKLLLTSLSVFPQNFQLSLSIILD